IASPGSDLTDETGEDGQYQREPPETDEAEVVVGALLLHVRGHVHQPGGREQRGPDDDEASTGSIPATPELSGARRRERQEHESVAAEQVLEEAHRLPPADRLRHRQLEGEEAWIRAQDERQGAARRRDGPGRNERRGAPHAPAPRDQEPCPRTEPGEG